MKKKRKGSIQKPQLATTEKRILVILGIFIVIAGILFIANKAQLGWFVIWAATITGSVIVGQIVLKTARLNKDKIPGKLFEYFFFIFLFMSSYFASYIIQRFMIDLITILFIGTMMGAFYSGWIHYIEGLSGKYVNKSD